MEYCNEHAAHTVRIETLDNSVKALWKKWDNLQRLLIVTLTTLCLNLLGVIVIIMKVFDD